jgi:hypothetical protein
MVAPALLWTGAEDRFLLGTVCRLLAVARGSQNHPGSTLRPEIYILGNTTFRKLDLFPSSDEG